MDAAQIFCVVCLTSELEVDQDNITDVLFESCNENVKACENHIPEIDKSLFKNPNLFSLFILILRLSKLILTN